MADKQPTKSKRRVKNPETFRERALKATEATDKPQRSARFKIMGRLVTPIFRPVAKIIGGLLDFKPFKLLGKILFPAYFRQSLRELRLVTWPSWRESRRLTYAVLVFAVIFGASIALVDYGLDKVFKNVLLK
ncbi:MAG TPA: preprotein translocase subunit SecE [Verrucomicrobiae bacterium]|jgi:preprotein translocase SecE subunit|nr:preprotein translocase subunit SecE [Verrucomicrobiae bacterium]